MTTRAVIQNYDKEASNHKREFPSSFAALCMQFAPFLDAASAFNEGDLPPPGLDGEIEAQNEGWSSFAMKRACLYAIGFGGIFTATTIGIGMITAAPSVAGVVSFVAFAALGVGSLLSGASIIDYTNPEELADARAEAATLSFESVLSKHSYENLLTYKVLTPKELYTKFTSFAETQPFMRIVKEYDKAAEAYRALIEKGTLPCEYSLPHPLTWNDRFLREIAAIKGVAFFEIYDLQLLEKHGVLSAGASRALLNLKESFASENELLRLKKREVEARFDRKIRNERDRVEVAIEQASREYASNPVVIRFEGLDSKYEAILQERILLPAKKLQKAQENFTNVEREILRGRSVEELTDDEKGHYYSQLNTFNALKHDIEIEMSNIKEGVKQEKAREKEALLSEVTLHKELRDARIRELKSTRDLTIARLEEAMRSEIEIVTRPYKAALERLETLFQDVLRMYSLKEVAL